MDLRLFRFILYPVDDSNIIIFDEDPLCIKFMFSIGDVYQSSYKHSFRDRRFKDTKALGRQKSTIRITDDILCTTLDTPNATIEVDLDKPRRRELLEKDKNFLDH